MRPIALCNVLYKIVAKVLANRLKTILPGLISEEQSAFVPGRNITDNVLVAFELIHYMKRKTSGEAGNVALKLDITKAYDRVNWDYLRNRMVAMGFSSKWINWMMLCVTTVSYSICFQGTDIGPIIPKRGLRQGDPLSPYFFCYVSKACHFLSKMQLARMIFLGVKFVLKLLQLLTCFLQMIVFYSLNPAQKRQQQSWRF